jgi:hypothetical protein
VSGGLGKSAMVDVDLRGHLWDSSVGVYCWGYLLLGKLGVGSSILKIIYGMAATTWSTALARDVGGRKNLAERQGTDLRVLARARAQFPIVYHLRDCSRSQVFVNKGESERLASSYHGAIVVARR